MGVQLMPMMPNTPQKLGRQTLNYGSILANRQLGVTETINLNNVLHQIIYFMILMMQTTNKLTLASNNYEAFLIIYILSYVLTVPLLAQQLDKSLAALLLLLFNCLLFSESQRVVGCFWLAIKTRDKLSKTGTVPRK